MTAVPGIRCQCCGRLFVTDDTRDIVTSHSPLNTLDLASGVQERAVRTEE